jgi:hypothetical protein
VAAEQATAERQLPEHAVISTFDLFSIGGACFFILVIVFAVASGLCGICSAKRRTG